MSNFTSLLFHRSTLSLVRAHMAEVPGGFPGGFGGVRGGSGTPKNPKKVKKTSKNRFFWHFFWFLAVFGRNLGKIWEKWSKMVKKGVKNVKKHPKNRGFHGFSKKRQKEPRHHMGLFDPKNPKKPLFLSFFWVFWHFFDFFWHFLTFFDKFVKNLWIFLFIFVSVELKSFLIHFDSRLKWIKKVVFWDPLGPEKLVFLDLLSGLGQDPFLNVININRSVKIQSDFNIPKLLFLSLFVTINF